MQSESRSVVSDSLRPSGLYSPWNSPGQNTTVGSLSLLQRNFPTQGWNPGLPHCRRILYQLSHTYEKAYIIKVDILICFDIGICISIRTNISGGTSLVVKTSPSNAGCSGSLPGWGAKIPHVLGPKNQKYKTEAILQQTQ